ncbi:OsmC family protein [Pseudoduganella umbonata]|uniref:OsmC family protein n=1 Tax=Pseudoduganella umbonata TaxID=864828 RepID=A0A4P8HMD9_9BURK|nr:OsmC family protein [Pseudoduganella umbonata]MBB3219418.1 putative redox protein [Pseudoduganella umbonata]QCP09508.1 OsmC family protein [Pseudoduganella umbonata]
MPITVRRDSTQPMRHIVHVRNHLVPADVSPEEGGADAGPSPHDLYDAALSSCKALTVLWYAKRKNIPVDDIQVTTTRDDSDERDKGGKGVYRLVVTLHLAGDLTETQRAELLSVAEKCPVHKLMTAVTTEVTTTLG